MASFKNRQPSDTNQSVPETDSVPETHSYQEKHFQPTVNEPVVENAQYTEYGSTVKPDPVNAKSNPVTRSDITERCDQLGEQDILTHEPTNSSMQGNSDSGTQYSTPDVGSGVSSGSEGYSHAYGTVGGGTAATVSSASTVAAASTATASATTGVVATAASAAVAATGAVLIAVTLVLPMVIGVPSAIIFDDIVVTDSSIYYSIYFEDYEEGMELYVCLHNNFTNRMHTVDSEYFSYVERDLKPNVDYTITVYGSMSAILEEKHVTTKPSSEVPTLTVNYCDYKPEKGVVSLSSTISGDTTAWQEYRAVLYGQQKDTDNKYEIASVMLESVDTEQDIRFQLEKDMSYDATFAIECSGEYGTETLYSTSMTVYGTPYFGFNASYDSGTDVLNISSTVYDPDGQRSEYYAIMTVTNASTGESYTDSRDLLSGGCEFTNVSHGYTFYDFEVRFQCNEGGKFVDITDRYFDFTSYTSSAVGNVQWSFTESQSAGTGATYGTLTVTYDMVNLGDLDGLAWMLGDKSSGWAASKPLSTDDRSFTYDLTDSSVRGTVQPLMIYSNSGNLLPQSIMIPFYISGSSTFSAAQGTLDAPSVLNVNYSVEDYDKVWSDYHYVLIQGDSSMEGSFDATGSAFSIYLGSGFVNGEASLSMSCTETNYGSTPTVRKFDPLTVSLYIGPTLTVTNAVFDKDGGSPVSSDGTLTVTLSIDDQLDQWTSLRATLESESGGTVTGHSEASFANDATSVVLTVGSDLRGTVASLRFYNGNDQLAFTYGGASVTSIDIDLYGNDSKLEITSEASETKAQNTDGNINLNVDLDYFDADKIYSNFTYTVTQGSASFSDSFTPENGTNSFRFSNTGFVNGSGTITITFSDRTKAGEAATVTKTGAVEIYVGPNMAVSSSSYDQTNGMATFSVSITDDYNEWSSLQARISSASSGTGGVFVDSEESGFNKTQTSLTFTMSPALQSDMFNVPLTLSLLNAGSSVYQCDETFTFPYSHFESYSTEMMNPSTGRGIDLTFSVSDPMGQWSGYTATVTQGTTTLYTGTVTPGDTANNLSFGSTAFTNGTAQLTLTCSSSSGTVTLLENVDIEVYYGPMLADSEPTYNGTSSGGTVSIPVTVTENGYSMDGRIRLYYETSSGVAQVLSNETVSHDTATATYIFTVTGEYLNRTLSMDMVDANGVHCSSNTLSTMIQYAFISLDSTPEPTDPYGASGRGLRLTVNGGGLDNLEVKASVSQTLQGGTLMLCSNTSVLTGTETVIAFDSVTFENGTATLSFSDQNRNPIPFADGSTEMTVQVYYAPAITSAAGGDYSGSGTVTSNIIVDDMFGTFTGKYVQLSYMDPDKITHSIRSTAAYDGQNATFTASFTLPTNDDIVYFLNTDLDVMFVNDGGELVGEEYDGTIRYRYVSFTGYTATPKDLTQYNMPGISLNLTFAPGSYPDFYTDMHLTIRQGDTTLFDEAWAPGGDIEFYTRDFANGTATLTLTCNDTFHSDPDCVLINGETIDVYSGPTIAFTSGAYDKTQGKYSATFAITDTYGQWTDKTATLTANTLSQPSLPSSTGVFDESASTFTFEVDSITGLRGTIATLTVKNGSDTIFTKADVDLYGYDSSITLDSASHDAPYSIGAVLTYTDLDGDYSNFSYVVEQESTGASYTGTFTPVNGANTFTFADGPGDAKFSNGTASLMINYTSGLYGNLGTGLNSVSIYVGPTINGITESYNASTSTGTLTVSVTDTYGQLNAKDGRVAMASSAVAGGRTSNEHFTSSSGTGTLTFAIESSSSFVNSELKFSFLNDEGGTFLEYAGTVMFRYVELTNYQTSIRNPSDNGPGQDITLTITGDSSLYTAYHATFVQEVTGCTMYDGDITLSPGDASGVFISSVKFTNTAFGNGEATLTISCMDGISGQRVNVIDGETIQVYCGPNINLVTTSYDGNQGIGTATINYQAEFGEWDGYYGQIDFYATGKQGHPITSNEAIDANGGIITFNLPVSSPMINESLKLFLLDGPEGGIVVIYPGITFEYTGSTVADIALSYDGSMETGTVNFTIVDTQGAWPDSLVVALVPDSDKIGPGVEINISKSDTNAQFAIATDSVYLNTPLYFVLRGDTELYRSTVTYTFDYADIMGLDWMILETGPSPAIKGISGTVRVSGPESQLSNYQIRIDQNDVTIFSGTYSTRPVDIEMHFSQYATNGNATVQITATRQGSPASATYQTTITVYTGLSITSIDGRATDGQGAGELSYDITYQGDSAYLEVNIGNQSENWKRAGPVTNGTGTLTFDLETSRNYNTELPVRMVYEDGTVISDTIPNVIFKYASMSTNTVDPLNPAEGSKGLKAFGISINDPYSLWTNYRAVVTVTGSGDILYDGDLEIDQEDNTAIFTFNNTPFENGTGTLTIYCTADGVENTEIYSRTVDLYNGPTMTVSDNMEVDDSGATSVDPVIFARCGELDTEVDETLTAVLYVDGIDDQMCPVSTSCYIADGSDPTFYVHVEFSDFALTEHRDSESAELVIYREVSTTEDRTEVVRTTVTLVSA